MRIEDLISSEVKQQLISVKKPKLHKQHVNHNRKNNGHKRKKQQEHLSEHQIKRLMGQYMPTYKRGRGGALRQRK